MNTDDARQSPSVGRQSPSDSQRQSPSGEASAADVLGPKEVLELQQAGRAAAVAGEPITACPWRDGAEDVDRARRDMWVRGYAAGRTELRAARAGDSGLGQLHPLPGASPSPASPGAGEGRSAGDQSPAGPGSA